MRAKNESGILINLRTTLDDPGTGFQRGDTKLKTRMRVLKKNLLHNIPEIQKETATNGMKLSVLIKYKLVVTVWRKRLRASSRNSIKVSKFVYSSKDFLVY